MSPVTAHDIDTALRAALRPQHLEVLNESHLHAGHAGAGEGSHWRVRIVAEAMAGQARVARHRLVYDALREVIPRGIHALAIEARSPAEASAVAQAARPAADRS